MSESAQGKGVVSTKHWGFLGFFAQRITDEESDIVTYAQYRMDYPYFGQVAKVLQLDATYGSETLTLARHESRFDTKNIVDLGGGDFTEYPYTESSTGFIYEGSTQLGASKTTNVLTVSSELITQVESTAITGTSVSSGSAGSTWGDIPVHTVTGLLNTTESTVTFNNRTTSGDWLISFPDAIDRESWAGAKSGSGILQDATLTAEVDSLRVASVTQYPNDSFLTLTTSIAYDSSGRATSTTVSGDNVTSRTTSIPNFTENRYPYQIVNPKSHTTTFSAYDLRFGAVKTTGDPNGRNTTRARDAFGRVTSTTNADNVVTATTINACSPSCASVYGVSPTFWIQTISTASANQMAPIRNTYFDNLGRVLRTEIQSFDGTAYSKRDVKYDSQGRIEKSSLPYFSGSPKDVLPEYDIRNRVKKVTRPDGSTTTIDFDVNLTDDYVTEEVTENILYANGTSAGSTVKLNEYNILGELKRTTDGEGTSTNPITTYTYDANGNVLTAVVNGGADGTTTTTFSYDAAGNQESIVGPNIGTVTNEFTALNELMKRTDNKSQVTTFDYDTLGRLEEIDNDDGISTWTWDTATYGAGKLKARSNPGFTETIWYTLEGRVDYTTREITPIGGSSSTSYTTDFDYDSYGRLDEITYPGGFEVTRVYNDQGYLAELKDGSTAIHTINDRNAFGNANEETYGNGIETERIFDDETGRIYRIHTFDGATKLQNTYYSWRTNGTLHKRTAQPANGFTEIRRENFSYDVLQRVTLARTYIDNVVTRDLAYNYDKLGNIENKTSDASGDTDVTSYVYGAGAAGPHAVTTASVDGTSYTLSYDSNGAVTEYDIAGTNDDKYIEYNVFNLPTKIVVGTSLSDSSPVARDEFAYGPDGQRYARKTTWEDGANTYTEEVTYLGAVEIITDDSTGTSQTITKTTISPNVMHVKIVGTTTDEFLEYAHRDHLGSIEIVTDENGDVLDSLAFEPFGSRKSDNWESNISSAELNDLLDVASDHSRKARGFTDHEHLDRTGFIHMNGRIYDPVLGRFISPDPIVQFPAFGQSWNRYSYTNNSPASFADPSGFAINVNSNCTLCFYAGTRPPYAHGGDPNFGAAGATRFDVAMASNLNIVVGPFENEVPGTFAKVANELDPNANLAVAVMGAGVTITQQLQSSRSIALVWGRSNSFYPLNPAAISGGMPYFKRLRSFGARAHVNGVTVTQILGFSGKYFLGPAGAVFEVFDNVDNYSSGQASGFEASFRTGSNLLAGLVFAAGPVGWVLGATWAINDPLSPESLAAYQKRYENFQMPPDDHPIFGWGIY